MDLQSFTDPGKMVVEGGGVNKRMERVGRAPRGSNQSRWSMEWGNDEVVG